MKAISQQGFVSLYLAVLLISLMTGLGASFSLISLFQSQSSRNATASLQAFYGAEGGIEDALLRLKKGINWSNPIVLALGDATASTAISDIIGGSRTLTSQGSTSGRTRNVEVLYQISSASASFFYGAHIGQGGLRMDNLSRVEGNVFSNGDIIGSSGTEITGSAMAAGEGRKIQNAIIGEDAFAERCEDSEITGILSGQSQSQCSFASFIPLSSPIEQVSLPITDQQIALWKQEAAAWGTLSQDYTLSGSEVAFLGPKKIEGNMAISNLADLTLQGTLWVTGDITLQNDAKVRLASSYGSSSGMIIADGKITLANNSISSGSGSEGSYLMYISASAFEEAIVSQNNAQADILYTSQGNIVIENNTKLRQITGYGLRLKNNAVVSYEIGLQNPSFISGPGGSWQVVSWKEI